MGPELGDRLRVTLLMETAELLSGRPEPSSVLFKRGDLSVELFAPHGSTPSSHTYRTRSIL